MRSFNLAEAVHKIPAALEDMLVRGAYLEHSARELEHSHREQQVRLQTVRATQPPFLFLRPKETRVAFQVASKDTSADLTALDQALRMNKKLCDHLRALSEEMLEKWLRTHCEEYRLGLAAGHFAVDWEHSLLRFTDHANTFIQALGSARNMAPAGYDRVRGVFSPSTYQAISAAHAAALKVEGEIAATNAIAAEHDKLLGKTVFNDPMPRLVQEPYAAVVAQIASLPPVSAQTEFNRVIAAIEDLLTRELDPLRNRVRDSAQNHAGRTQSYVRDAWNQLHAHAVEHSVDSAHIGTVVEQTERTYMMDSSLVLA
ncbi:MAG: hypothetical protein ABW223_09685 [Rariglobus sp.]